MKKKAALWSIFLVFILISSAQVSLAQVRRSRVGMQSPQRRDVQRRREQRQLENQQRSQEFQRIRQEYQDEASQEALGMDTEQWKLVKPKMQRIRELRVQPSLNFSIYGSATGSSESSTSSSYSRSMPGGGRGAITYGSGGGSAGGAAGGARGSARFGAGGSSGAAGGIAGGGSASSSGSSYWHGFGPRVGPNGDRPIKKQVGEMSLGWTWLRPSEGKKPDELTDGEKRCERLLDAVTAETPDWDLVQQRVEQLRQFRKEKLRQLRQTQQQLRELVTPEQEAKLILMGYLDFSWAVSTGPDAIK